MTLLSLLLVGCVPNDAEVKATYAFYMADDTSDSLAGLRARNQFEKQTDLVPVDCRELAEETLRLTGADTACAGEEPVWFPWISRYAYYLKEGTVSTDDDIYRAEALINSEGDLQLTVHADMGALQDFRFGFTIDPHFQPTECADDGTGAMALQNVDGDWLAEWSANDDGYTVWELNGGSFQVNPNNQDDYWYFPPEWEAGVSFARFGDEPLIHRATDFQQEGFDGASSVYYPLYMPGVAGGLSEPYAIPEPAGDLTQWASDVQTFLTEQDDLTRLASGEKFKLNYRAHSNAWRPVDDLEPGLDNWIDVSLGYVRIKNFNADDVKAGKVNLTGDFQIQLQGTDSPSRLYVNGTFTIDHLSEVKSFNPLLEDVKREEYVEAGGTLPACK
ncbi:MAG TPA: hypothetical protein PKY30_01035 [Myxococcota bacterium]|nr:hypothetical protein [Myxococcota bacterium]HNH45587.1 hypothetical protein [Myxococcota bacterium]